MCAIEIQEIDDDAEEQRHLADPILEELRKAASKDIEYKKLASLVEEGFPADRHTLEKASRQFWAIRTELSTDDGLILVVPAAAPPDVHRKLHAAHQGLERTKRRARQSVYWPGINSDITKRILCRLSHTFCKPAERAVGLGPIADASVRGRISRLF